MDLNEVRALIAIDGLGSVKAAAASLGWARGTVRRRLESLESRVGRPLVVRDERGTRLTDAGKTIVARGRKLLSDAEHMMLAAQQAQVASGALHARSLVGVAPVLHRAISAFILREMPHLQYRLSFAEDPLEEPLTEYDVLFHFGPRAPGQLWHTVPVARVPERLYASPRYAREHGLPTAIAELRSHRLLAWKPPEEPADVWALSSDGERIEVTPVYVTSSMHALFHAVDEGLGIGLVPCGNIEGPDIDYASLIEVLPGEIGRARQLCLSFRRSLKDDASVRKLWDYVMGMARSSGVEIESGASASSSGGAN